MIDLTIGKPHDIKTLEYSKLIYPYRQPKCKIKIGYVQEGIDRCDEVIQDVFNKALHLLKECDHIQLLPSSIPNHKEAPKYATPILMTGQFDTMFTGYGHGSGISGFNSHTLVKKLMEGCSQNCHELSETLKFLLLTSDYLNTNYGSYHSAKASTLCAHLKKSYNQALESFDVLIMPTMNKMPVKLPDSQTPLGDKVSHAFQMTSNTCIFNLTGHPSLSLNCGFVGDFPVGLMIIGKHFDEVLNAASIIEEHLRSDLNPR